jgi:hypothetical protein
MKTIILAAALIVALGVGCAKAQSGAAGYVPARIRCTTPALEADPWTNGDEPLRPGCHWEPERKFTPSERKEWCKAKLAAGEEKGTGCRQHKERH